MLNVKTEITLIPNREFTRLATDAQIARAAQALEAHNIHTIVADTGEEAKKLVLELVPKGAEVLANVSKTLEKLGITEEIDKSGRYDAVRPKVMSLDRKTQADEIRILRSHPTYIIGSVHAVTEKGQVLTASFGGSQLGSLCLRLREGNLGDRRTEDRQRPGRRFPPDRRIQLSVGR